MLSNLDQRCSRGTTRATNSSPGDSSRPATVATGLDGIDGRVVGGRARVKAKQEGTWEDVAPVLPLSGAVTARPTCARCGHAKFATVRNSTRAGRLMGCVQ